MLGMLLIPIVISFSRIFALAQYYHAPLSIVHHFENSEVPAILSRAGYTATISPKKAAAHNPSYPVVAKWNASLLMELPEADKPRLCWGDEWYRYPSSWLVPEGVDVRWIEGAYDGAVPQKWEPSVGGKDSGSPWKREETRVIREGKFNDKAKASKKEDVYVSLHFLSIRSRELSSLSL